MSHQKEKSAGELDAPKADSKEQCITSLSVAESLGNNVPADYSALQARFALRGGVLTRSHRVPCGHVSYVAIAGKNSRYFNTLAAAQAHLIQLEARQ